MAQEDRFNFNIPQLDAASLLAQVMQATALPGRRTSSSKKSSDEEVLGGALNETLFKIPVGKLLPTVDKDSPHSKLTIKELTALPADVVGGVVNPESVKKGPLENTIEFFLGSPVFGIDREQEGLRFKKMINQAASKNAMAEAAERSARESVLGTTQGSLPDSIKEFLSNEGLLRTETLQPEGPPINPSDPTIVEDVVRSRDADILQQLGVDEVFSTQGSKRIPDRGIEPIEVPEDDVALTDQQSKLAFAKLKSDFQQARTPLQHGETPESKRKDIDLAQEKAQAEINKIETDIQDKIRAGAVATEVAKLKDVQVDILKSQLEFKERGRALGGGLKILEAAGLEGEELATALNDLMQLFLDEAPDITVEQRSFLQKLMSGNLFQATEREDVKIRKKPLSRQEEEEARVRFK